MKWIEFTEWKSDRILALRKKYKFSQVELAEKLGTRQQQVSMWELDQCEPSKAYQRLLTWLEKELGK